MEEQPLDHDQTAQVKINIALVLFQGKQFSIWKLSDLKDCDKTVSFFLFGNVYKEHWKNDTGTVIGLLNATMMDKSEKVRVISLAFQFIIWAASWLNQQNGMCTQQRLRSVRASTQSDQSLRCPRAESLGP